MVIRIKIGIVTFHSAHNYGAVLQAWSLREYLTRQGHLTEIINLRLRAIDNLYRFPAGPQSFCVNPYLNTLLNRGYRVLHYALKTIRYPHAEEKYRKFERFIRRDLHTAKPFLSLADLRQAQLDYDVLIAGSDQIWNTKMTKGLDPAYFLQFGRKDARRISYAASIGTEETTGLDAPLFQRYLKDFDAISVREEYAKALLSPLTDKKIHVMADPTFLLRQQDFQRLQKRTRIRGSYIYVHNVHLVRVDEALYQTASELSKRTGLPIAHNHHRKQFETEAGYFTGGPEEFLGMIAGAEMVVTNSFHATVFALIYQKPFVTVPHYKNPGRMQNLLAQVGLSNHLIKGRDDLPNDLGGLAIDYPSVEEKLAQLRRTSERFLLSALTGNTEAIAEPV